MTRRKLRWAFLIVFAVAGTYIASLLSEGSAQPSPPPKPLNCGRIVSLAPSITEILYSLDLGDNVVGVTRFCKYPPEALTKTKVGGYYDPNYEIIVGLKPDVVFTLIEHEASGKYLTSLGIKTLPVNNSTIAGIKNAISKIGAVCGRKEKADGIVSRINKRIEQIKSRTAGFSRPKVMVSIGRTTGGGSIKDVYISGKDGFYDEMITLAGGENAFSGLTMGFSAVSREGIIRMNPDVIIEMIPDFEKTGLDEKAVIDEWNSLTQVNAVKSGRIYIFREDYTVIPGPRFILTLEKMAGLIHPEIN